MRFICAHPGGLSISVPGRKPQQAGPEELVFPNRRVKAPQGKFFDLDASNGKRAFKRYGISGLIEVPEDATSDTEAHWFMEAKKKRFSHLRSQLDAYRMQQGARQAGGAEVMMPSASLRKIHEEAKVLRLEIVEQPNPILSEEVAKVAGVPDEIKSEDPLGDDLREFGISPNAAPLQPGMTVFDQGLPNSIF